MRSFRVHFWPEGGAPGSADIDIPDDLYERIMLMDHEKEIIFPIRRRRERKTDRGSYMTEREMAFQKVFVRALRKAHPERIHQIPDNLFIARVTEI